MRGIRGAITIKNDTEAEIVAAVRWMVTEMIRHNGVKPEDVGGVSGGGGAADTGLRRGSAL